MGTSRFVAAGTNIPPNLPTTALVVDGIYGRTRNPLYLGTTLIYLGLSVAAGSLRAIVLVVPLLWVINVGVIARKDRLAQVPKWVSIFTHPTQECFVMQRKEMNCWPCAPRYGEKEIEILREIHRYRFAKRGRRYERPESRVNADLP
jgi:hypothetical protein